MVSVGSIVIACTEKVNNVVQVVWEGTIQGEVSLHEGDFDRERGGKSGEVLCEERGEEFGIL